MKRQSHLAKVLMVMETRVCKYCGKTFKAQEGAGKEYCSDTCKNRAMYPPKEYQKICEYCNNKFTATGAGARDQKFCSDRCRYAEERRRERGEEEDVGQAGPHAQNLFDMLSSLNFAWGAWAFPVETDVAEILVTIKDIGRYLDTLGSKDFESRFMKTWSNPYQFGKDKIKALLRPWAELAGINGYGNKGNKSVLKNQAPMEKDGPLDKRGILEGED